MAFVKRHRTYYKYGTEPNVTVVGSPTINEGVVSGFSASNYLVLPENFDVTGGKTWQMFYKIRTGSDVKSIQSVTGTNYYRYDPVAILVESSKFELDICSATGTTLFNKAGTYTVLPNTDYWIKMSFDGAKYTFDYSLDGISYINDISYSSTTSVYSQPLAIGIQCASSNGSFSSPWLGSIDLSQSYIKINGKEWWHGTKAVESNSSDYDYYIDRNKAYNILRRNREYFKYKTWNQPILTSATSYGTITASSDHSSDSSEPWQILTMEAVEGRRFLFTGTENEWLQWKLPEPIKITSCDVCNSSEASYLNRFPKSITLQVSDDGSSWKTIGSASGYTQPGNSESISFTCNSDKAYSYIRWQFAQTFGASPMAVGVIKLNAKKVSSGASSNYDFYKDSYKAYNIVDPSWESGSQTFNYTGALQTYTVPEGVTSVQVDCVGAKGYTGNLEGGLGGRVKTKLTVTPGQELKVWVGQVHSQITTPEYNASDIRTSSADITSEEGLLSRLIVAGGGGDGSQTNWGGGKGGHGGGLIGGSSRAGYGTEATGGTQTAGGTGGTHGAVYGGGSGQGYPGTFGLGGATKKHDASYSGCGGAGWYGGGGGSVCSVNKIWSVNGVAGAGGSSYTDPELCSEVSHAQGFNNGNGYVKITYRRRRF